MLGLLTFVVLAAIIGLGIITFAMDVIYGIMYVLVVIIAAGSYFGAKSMDNRDC